MQQSFFRGHRALVASGVVAGLLIVAGASSALALKAHSSARVPVSDVSSAASASAAPLAAGEAAGSGEAMPTGDLADWHQVIAEDFTTPASLGSFASAYPGWASYDGMTDTSREYRPKSTTGVWQSKTTSSVADGAFTCHLHTQGTVPQVCALTPQTGSTNWWSGQKYGRYSVRFKTDLVPGYKIAWLLWPSDDVWKEGEVDFPEAYLDQTITGSGHELGDPAKIPFYTDMAVTPQSWHTATIEWTPGKLVFDLDGKTWTSTDPKVVPTTSMRWALQAESQLKSTPPDPTVAGDIEIDWVTQYTWTGSN